MESDRSPSRSTVTNRNGGNAFTEYSTLTVRDYFAAKSLTALIQAMPEVFTWESRAQWCYEMADAMLREREKQK